MRAAFLTLCVVCLLLVVCFRLIPYPPEFSASKRMALQVISLVGALVFGVIALRWRGEGPRKRDE